MKYWDYDAVTYDADIYCVECLPNGISENDDDVYPVFADSEWDYYPVCCVCGAIHDYVSLTNEGYKYEHQNDDNEEED